MKKSILTHSLIIIGFLLINTLVHYPSILGNKTLKQHDIIQGRGSYHQIRSNNKETGELPLWNPYIFSGMPAFLALYPPVNLLYNIHVYFMLKFYHPTGLLLGNFIAFYILLLCFKVRPWIAAIGAISFGLNGFNVISIMAGHNAKIAAVMYMPLVLAGIHLIFSGRRWLGFGLTALALGLELKANHPQISYYLVIIVLAYGIKVLIETIKNKNYKSFGINTALVIVATCLAVGANYTKLASVLEYSKYTIRGKAELKTTQTASSGGLSKEYAFEYSNGILEPLVLFVPNIFGGSSQQEVSKKSALAEAFRKNGYNRSQITEQLKTVPTYWGDQPYTAPYFAGTIVVLLFILSLLILPKKQISWLVVLIILGIMMSWGKNFETFNYLLYDYLPLYNKFRSVTFSIIICIFAINLLGFVALEKLVKNGWDDDLRKKLYILFGIGGGFLLFLIVFSGFFSYHDTVDTQYAKRFSGFPDWFIDALINALHKDRKSILIQDSLRALAFVVGFALIIWAFAKRQIKTSIVVLGVFLLVFIDNFSLTKRFLGEEKFKKTPSKEFFKMSEADKIMDAQTKDSERVLNLQNPFNENRTPYYHESIGGYHAAKLRRYQDLIEHCITTEMQSAIQTLQSQSLDFSNLPVLNMLNTKFMYAGTEKNSVFPNHFANGTAWTVSEIIPVNSPDEEIKQISSLDTKRQAVIDQSKFQIPQILGSGKILLTKKTPNSVKYTSTIENGFALGVFSEVYYPDGWIATIDGKEVEILRVNYILRALSIPAGQHEILFEFKPDSYFKNNTITAIGSWSVLFAFLIGLGMDMRSKIMPIAKSIFSKK